jgi:FtsZ-interacting cell division protein YlmF
MALALPLITGAPRGRQPLGGRRDSAMGAALGAEILVLVASGLEDGAMAIEAVRSGRSVLLNVCHLSSEEGTRLLDFTRGGIAAMDGQFWGIGEAVFLFTRGLCRVEADPALI